MSRIPSWRQALASLPRPALVLAVAALAALPPAVYFLAESRGEPVQQVAVALPGEALAATTNKVTHLWENVKVRTGDTLARILTSRGHTPATVHQIVSSGPAGEALTAIKVGTTLKVATDHDGQLSEISYQPDPYRVVNVRRNSDGVYESEIVEKPAVTVQRFAEGTIEDSLFGAGKRAGVSDTVILEIADVFGYDIDFALEVQQGDSFRVLFEEVLVEGEKVRDGDVLAAEFVNEGRTYRAVRYKTSDGRVGYYTPEGMAMRKAFLRTPVDFARISSGFTTRRLHPVLHTVRAHKGVDYAAARGTPVKAAGDGRIEYAGNKGGYGRTIIIQHGGSKSTLYAHLNGFAKNIRSGARVSQGQVIGYVGSTGLASGPHLHYEFRVNGVHVNPLKVKTAEATPIAASEKQAFLAESTRLVAMLDNFSGRTAVAQAAPARNSQAKAN